MGRTLARTARPAGHPTRAISPRRAGRVPALARSRHPARRIELAVDVRHVRLHGVDRDEAARGELGVGEPARQVGEQLELTGGERLGRAAARRLAAPARIGRARVARKPSGCPGSARRSSSTCGPALRNGCTRPSASAASRARVARCRRDSAWRPSRSASHESRMSRSTTCAGLGALGDRRRLQPSRRAGRIARRQQPGDVLEQQAPTTSVSAPTARYRPVCRSADEDGAQRAAHEGRRGDPVGGTAAASVPSGSTRRDAACAIHMQLHATVRRGADVSLVECECAGFGLAALDRDERACEVGVGGRRVVEQLELARQLERLVGELGGAHQSPLPRLDEREAPQDVHPIGAVAAAGRVERALEPVGAPPRRRPGRSARDRPRPCAMVESIGRSVMRMQIGNDGVRRLSSELQHPLPSSR